MKEKRGAPVNSLLLKKSSLYPYAFTMPCRTLTKISHLSASAHSTVVEWLLNPETQEPRSRLRTTAAALITQLWKGTKLI